METAMCLIEANQPVYPLDIVRQMRDQRAMLIQTAVSYQHISAVSILHITIKIIVPFYYKLL